MSSFAEKYDSLAEKKASVSFLLTWVLMHVQPSRCRDNLTLLKHGCQENQAHFWLSDVPAWIGLPLSLNGYR
uniref:Uncharacterized protein n=1 Tax=Romanomermis culicivorax TaxID=13658 RepID=A0A915KJA7_ROMCU